MPDGTRRHCLRSGLAAVFLLSVAACHGKAVADPQQSAESNSLAAAAPTHRVSPGRAGLSVEVTPSDGISIWLDATKVAVTSPGVAVDLEPGPHTLLVRGMGYYPISLPVTLKADEMIRVPVSLRARAAATQAAQPIAVETPPRAAPPPPTSQTAQPTPLPSGKASLLLHMVAVPAAPILLDGLAVSGREMRFRHARGTLQVGALRMAYDVTANRVLELEVPSDEAAWFKDGTQVKSTTVIRLTIGSTRLQRVSTDGEAQSLVVKRVY